MMGDMLTDRERQLIRFEHVRWNYAGRKETAVREKFGVSMVTYWLELKRAIEKPEAMAFDPIKVKELIARRDASPSRPKARQTPVH